MVRQLAARPLEKLWGRRRLASWFSFPEASGPIGEIVFDPPVGTPAALLVKYLFTSEALSVQVHPDDATARRRGLNGGKEEAWLILDADDNARIALGLTGKIDPDRLAASARDGTIEQWLDWKPVAAGDIFYVPAGTIHAIGAGITLVEIQQNKDITYRLYDYGRPRELHLDAAMEAATLAPYSVANPAVPASPGRQRIVDGSAIAIDHWSGVIKESVAGSVDRPVTFVPLAGGCRLDGTPAEAGSVWQNESATDVEVNKDGVLLIAFPVESGSS